MAQLTSGQFSLLLLGAPVLTDSAGSSIPGLASGKPLALLAYLSIRGEVRRDELIELLWGGTTEANARNAFRQSLHRLRTGLGENMIESDRERVTISGRERIVVDRDAFLKLLDAGRPEPALELYRGDFLEGMEFGEPGFDEWADAERTRLRGRFTWALGAATQGAMQAGRWNEASHFAQRLTAALPYDESAATTEATVLVSAGRRQEAAGTLTRFVQRLETDLDLRPSAAITQMLGRLARADSSPAKSQAEVPRGPQAPQFVGREHELAALIAAYRDLASERGSTLLVTGEPGIGKSRLLEEFLARARALGKLLVLHGRERAGGAAIPYASVAEALRGTLRAPGVGGASQHLLAEAARILPELRDSFDLPAAGPIDDDASRLRFFEGIAALLEAVAYEQPVALVLDDVHHASASTLDLVSYLTARLQSSPVLILLALRAEALPRSYAARLGLDESTPSSAHAPRRLNLEGLGDEQIRALLRASLGAADESLDIERSVALAAGNPLRAIQAASNPEAGVAEHSLPVTIHDMLRARLEAAPPSRRRVFFAAALLQRSVSLRLLAAAAHLSEAATMDCAVTLERDGLLVQQDDGYTLAHDTTASLIVELSGTAGRALFAGWAADALASEHGAAPAELAYLYGLAGRQQLAFSNARRAAFAALACGAEAEASRLFGLALTFAPSDDERAEIEAAMSGSGAERRRLASGAPPPPPPAEPATQGEDAGAAREQPAAQPDDVAAPARRRAIRPSLVVAGFATLLLAAFVLVRGSSLQFQFSAPADSLLVVERGHERDSTAEIVRTRRNAPAFAGTVRRTGGVPWVAGLALPWINPDVAPGGRHVSIERMTRTGTDLYVVSADQRDTLPVASGGGDNIALGWAPDGTALLVSRPRQLADGSYDTDLYEYRLDRMKAPIAIDTSAGDAVAEAEWSPDGSRIAWSARLGATHQQDVFISHADGTGARNVTRNPADDNHASWSPDGTLLAFTSDRNGNADLYAYDLYELRLWRLTFSPAQDDHAVFSPDSRRVAFESTRDGDAAVYVMPALGGDARRVTPAGGQFTILRWRGEGPGYVDRVRILARSSVPVGDTLSLSLTMLNERGQARGVPGGGLEWRLLDSSDARLLPGARDTSDENARRLVAKHDGTARVVASVPGWRSDTLTVLLGRAASPTLRDDFANGLDAKRWISLGDPSPRVGPAPGGAAGSHVLYPNGDLQWESGALARDPVLLQAGLTAQARVYVPFVNRAMQPASLELSLIQPPDLATMDATAPRLTPVVSVIWDGESGRVTYAVNGESYSQNAAVLGAAASHLFAFSVDASGHVQFFVDGHAAWRSTTRLALDGATRLQLWVGGRGTGSSAAVGDVELRRTTP
jgi:DNA-binding SARP family transcriptional activator